MRGKTTGRYSPSRSGSDDDGGGERWLTTYGDAITLLLAFFVMLYAMSEVSVEKFEAFVSGLRIPFHNEAAANSLLPPGSSLVGDAGLTGSTEGPVASAVAPLTPAAVVPPDNVGGPAKDTDQLKQIEQEVSAALAGQQLDSVATYRYDHRGLVVSLGTDNVLFATGSTTISPLGREIIATVAGVLSDYPNDIVVEGHTDDVPLDRTGYTNWNLSTDRAVAVLEMLIDDFGIDPDRLGATGYGEQRPLVPNDTPAHRARNRRVDVLVVAQEKTHG